MSTTTRFLGLAFSSAFLCFGCGANSSTGAPTNGGACKDAVATGSPGLIDDLNHEGPMIPNNDGRQGMWSTWNDGTGTQTPAGHLDGDCPANNFTPTNGQACMSGSGFANYAGMGVNLLWGENSCKSCNYDASAYRGGVRFTISGSVTGSLRFAVQTAETADVRFGGTCTDGAKCWDTFGLDMTVTTQPKVAEIPWSALRQQGWGTPALFDLRHMWGLSWQVNKAGATPVSFDNLCVDDVSLF
jgi:hypothetical protein